jgi:hypothetical protein
VSKAREGQSERRVAREDRRRDSRRRSSAEELPRTPELTGVDPYNTGPVPILDPAEKSKRRSLDDMRQLSEVIKAVRPAK